jgi:hypothetical protein
LFLYANTIRIGGNWGVILDQENVCAHLFIFKIGPVSGFAFRNQSDFASNRSQIMNYYILGTFHHLKIKKLISSLYFVKLKLELFRKMQLALKPAQIILFCFLSFVPLMMDDDSSIPGSSNLACSIQ